MQTPVAGTPRCAAPATTVAEYLDRYSTIVEYLDTVAMAPGGHAIGSPVIQMDAAWRDDWLDVLRARDSLLVASPGASGTRVWAAVWRVRDDEGRVVASQTVTLLEQLDEGEVQP